MGGHRRSREDRGRGGRAEDGKKGREEESRDLMIHINVKGNGDILLLTGNHMLLF